MQPEELKEFNQELKELLTKYNATLQIEEKIVVAKLPEKKEEVLSETTGSKA